MGIGGIGSLGDDVLDCEGRVSASSRVHGAHGARRRIGSDGGVHIFTHKDGQYWRVFFFLFPKK